MRAKCKNRLVILSILLMNLLFAEKEFAPWGNDSSLTAPISPKENPKISMGSDIVCSLLYFFQKVISPIDGPRSNFRPTSSRYMQLAIQRYGFFHGYIMGCDRLLRENDEKWIYPTIVSGGSSYKYDPAYLNKSQR